MAKLAKKFNFSIPVSNLSTPVSEWEVSGEHYSDGTFTIYSIKLRTAKNKHICTDVLETFEHMDPEGGAHFLNYIDKAVMNHISGGNQLDLSSLAYKVVNS